MLGIVVGGAVRHLDQQAARALDQQRQRVMRRDQMRIDAKPQQAQAVLEIMVPDRLVPFEQLLAAPDVVDQDVEAALLGADALDQLADIVGDEVVDRDGNALAAGRRDKLGRLLDGLGSLIFGLTGRASCGRSRRPSRRQRPARPRCRGRRRALRRRPARLFLEASSKLSQDWSHHRLALCQRFRI